MIEPNETTQNVDLEELKRSECCGAVVSNDICNVCKAECDWGYDLEECDNK